MPPRGMKVGRPLGARSPWTFALATSLGAATLDVVPPRAVPAIFVHTAVSSNARSFTVGNLTEKVPAGPDPARCCRIQAQPVALSVAAPGASPRLPIQPRRGTPVATRPWIAAGAREQTPIVPWPARNPS